MKLMKKFSYEEKIVELARLNSSEVLALALSLNKPRYRLREDFEDSEVLSRMPKVGTP